MSNGNLQRANNPFHFQRSDFSVRGRFQEAIIIFMSWFVPSFIFVFLVNFLDDFLSVEYFRKALQEGVGPELWNVMASFGIILFGVTMIFPSCRWLAFSTNRILINVYAIGSMMFGILLAQLILGLSNSSLEAWKAWSVGLGVTLAVALVLMLVLLTWYLSILIYDGAGDTSFITMIKKNKFRHRISLGCIIISASLIVMLSQG